jgi:hypothetical protein
VRAGLQRLYPLLDAKNAVFLKIKVRLSAKNMADNLTFEKGVAAQ